MTFRLRKAEEADLDFIWRLRAATMKDAISQSYGWDEETQRRRLAGKGSIQYRRAFEKPQPIRGETVICSGFT